MHNHATLRWSQVRVLGEVWFRILIWVAVAACYREIKVARQVDGRSRARDADVPRWADVANKSPFTLIATFWVWSELRPMGWTRNGMRKREERETEQKEKVLSLPHPRLVCHSTLFTFLIPQLYTFASPASPSHHDHHSLPYLWLFSTNPILCCA